MCMPSRVMLWDMSCHTGSDTYTLTGAANGTQAVMCLCCSLSPTHTHTRKTVEASLYVGISVQGSPLHTHTHTHTHKLVRTHARTHACTHVRTRTHMHACTHVRTHMHTHTRLSAGMLRKFPCGTVSIIYTLFVEVNYNYTADKGGTGHAQETSHHSYLH